MLNAQTSAPRSTCGSPTPSQKLSIAWGMARTKQTCTRQRERDQEAWLEEKRARDTQEAAAHEDVALGAAHASQQSHTRTRGVHEITQVQMRDGLCTRHRPSVTREARHLTLSPPASHLLKLTGSRLTIRAIHPSADAVPTSRLPPLPSWAAAVRQSGPSPRAQLAIR